MGVRLARDTNGRKKDAVSGRIEEIGIVAAVRFVSNARVQMAGAKGIQKKHQTNLISATRGTERDCVILGAWRTRAMPG